MNWSETVTLAMIGEVVGIGIVALRTYANGPATLSDLAGLAAGILGGLVLVLTAGWLVRHVRVSMHWRRS